MSPTKSVRDPVDASRVRRIPKHFGWIDHALRERLHRLSLEETALLFFLHIAADKNGCSYWSDAGIGRKLGIREGEVIEARYGLVSKGLIVYRYPLFQILPLEASP